MALGMSVALRNARLSAITTAVGTSGVITFYSGTRPATGAAVPSGSSALVTVPCSATFAGSPTNGTLTLNALTPAIAMASGTATWARLATSTGTFVMDMDVGTSGADVNLVTNVITLGITVAINSYVITEGNA